MLELAFFDSDLTYKEYDLFPKAKGIDRGPHRLVVGSNGRAYYTQSLCDLC